MAVLIKLANGSEHSIDVSDFSITVAQFKEECGKVVSSPGSELRVVFRGKIFQDAKTLESYGVEDGSILHVVRSRAQAPPPAESASSDSQSSQTPPSSQSNPASQVPQANLPNPYAVLSPGIGDFAARSPLEGMMNNEAAMTNLLQSDMFRRLLTNPEMMRTMQQMSLSQMNMTEEQRMAFAQTIASNPALQGDLIGLAAEMFRGNNMPMGNPGTFGMPPTGFAGVGAPTSGSLSSFPQGMQTGLERAQNNFSTGGFAPLAPRGDPRVIYRQQLQEIKDMGFPNEEAILIALEQAQGNVSFAVDRLLNAP